MKYQFNNLNNHKIVLNVSFGSKINRYEILASYARIRRKRQLAGENDFNSEYFQDGSAVHRAFNKFDFVVFQHPKDTEFAPCLTNWK